VLSNPIYVGEIRHKDLCHPGQHEPILDRELWERTQQQRRERTVRNDTRQPRLGTSPLTGRLFDENGDGLTPSHARKGDRRYRYYVSRNLITHPSGQSPSGWRLPARQIEDSVAAAVREMLDDETSVLHAAQDTDADPPRVDRVFQAAHS
jgi:site-specific DNA recombinase